jgi:hypothetical protein
VLYLYQGISAAFAVDTIVQQNQSAYRLFGFETVDVNQFLNQLFAPSFITATTTATSAITASASAAAIITAGSPLRLLPPGPPRLLPPGPPGPPGPPRIALRAPVFFYLFSGIVASG